jgi:S1 RNA binding domain protein
MTLEKNKIYKAIVKKIMPFGAFVDIVNPENRRDRISGMVHISEVDIKYVKEISEFLKVEQEVEVVLLGVNENGKYSFSIKKAMEMKNNAVKSEEKTSKPPFKENDKRDFQRKKDSKKDAKDDDPFEAMMSRFKRISEDKMCDLNRGRDRKNNSRGSR